MTVVEDNDFHPLSPGPYTARSASRHTDDWPYWFVACGAGWNCLGGAGTPVLIFRDRAERLAEKWNEADGRRAGKD